MSSQKYIKRIFSYSFKDSINKVFLSFEAKDIFKKSGITFNENVLQPENETQISLIKIESPSPYILLRKCSLKKEKDDYKSISEIIKKTNEKGEMLAEIIVRYAFYSNTCDNSTIFFLEILNKDPKSEFYSEFLRETLKKEKIMKLCVEIEKFLESCKKPFIQIESVVIHRSIKQIFSIVSNFEDYLVYFYKKDKYELIKIGENRKEGTEYYVLFKNSNEFIKYITNKIIETKEGIIFKMNREIFFDDKLINQKAITFSMIKLSQITTYVLIESQIPCFFSRNFENSLSQISKIYLNDVRNKAEHVMLLEE